MKQKVLYIILFCTLSIMLNAQLNLVPNPSFEEKDTCPYDEGLLDLACKNWFTPIAANPDTTLLFPYTGYGSSDYYNVCANAIAQGIPKNLYGYQYPVSGNAYAGIVLRMVVNQNNVLTTYKEYIEVELLKPLTNSFLYKLEFYYSITHDEYIATFPHFYYPFEVQALLTDTLLYRKNDSLTPNWVENIYSFTSFNHLFPSYVDTTSWFKASFEFEANGGEKFLTIGSFKDYPFATETQGAFIYIDDVSLTYIGPDTTPIPPAGEIQVYPNPAKDYLTIRQENSSLQNTRFELYDLTGRLLINYTIPDDSEEVKIPLWHLSSSLYIYAIRKDNELLKKGKLIVVR